MASDADPDAPGPGSRNTGAADPEAGDPQATAVERRRLRFRCWHRGTREADLLLGSFADAHIDGLDAEQLARFGALLENNDPDLYDWMTGKVPVPPEHDHDVMQLLKAHRYRKPDERL
jgi:antitoxin CptB